MRSSEPAVTPSINRNCPAHHVAVCVWADAHLWDLLAVSAAEDISPIVQPIIDAGGDLPIPSAESLLPQLLERAKAIDWEARLKNDAAQAARRGVESQLECLI